MTAIHLCAKHGHVNILDALDGHVNWRITSKKVTRLGFSTMKTSSFLNKILWMTLRGMLIALFFQTGLSAIHCAAHYGQVDFVREMLTKVPATVKSEYPGGGDSGLKDLGAEVSLFYHM